MVKIYDEILEDHKAVEIMEDGNFEACDEAAMFYFRNIVECEPSNYELNDMPTFKSFVGVIYGDWELYHDYGAGYYFAVKEY